MSSITSEFFSSKIIRRPLPEAVLYDLNSTSSTRITLPTGSEWSSGLHWHNTHTEYLRLIQGSIRVVLGFEEQIITALPNQTEQDQIVLTVPKGTRHEWSRAIIDDGIDVSVEESTDPTDGLKTVFFWSVNAVVLEGIEGIKGSKTGLGRWFEGWLLWWKLMIVFCELDNWPVFYRGRFGVESLCTYIILASAHILGWIMRLNVIRKNTMPADIWHMWTRRGDSKVE
jgi:hypothetical protein